MADNNKDTIYIDIDDEITAIIDKVQASSGRVVALVLPKRATMLQSIVNMKLLKRTADTTKKNIVLVTTESSLMPLAGAVGLHVAKTPNSRPEIPLGPDAIDDEEEQVSETDLLSDDDPEFTAENAGARPVGDLAAGAGATMPLPSRPKPDSGIETLELDNEDPKPAVGAASAGLARAAAKKPAGPKNKKLHIPDFNRFRMMLIFGGLALVLLIVGGYFALVVMPKATIAIKTNASNVNTDIDFALSTSASNLSTSSKTVPAKEAKIQKTYTGAAQATGQKNNGEKATGAITMTVCATNFNATTPIPAGVGVSSGSKTFITQERAVLSPAGGCNGGSGFRYRADNVAIKAQNPGTQYNVSGADFKVAGRSDVTATGSASGGTDDIQTVISQADIDNAKGKIDAGNTDVRDELKDQLDDQGLYAITATYNAGAPEDVTSAKVGDEASSVTVTRTVTYTMLGAKESDLKALVDQDIKSQIDTSVQGILTQGINQGAFKVRELTASGANMNIQTTAEVGPSIDTTAVARDAAGKKSSEIKSAIASNPDITDVTVKMSPFWVTKAPKNVDKITVVIEKPTRTANAD